MKKRLSMAEATRQGLRELFGIDPDNIRTAGDVTNVTSNMLNAHQLEMLDKYIQERVI